MPTFEYDIGVIGGGAAGLTVTAGAAQLGAKTLLIEKKPSLGGDCLHFGCVPSKTLIRSANVYHMIKNAAAYGLPEVEPPAVDFALVAGRIRSVIGVIEQHDSPERFRKLGAEVRFGRPRFVDDHTVDLDGNRLSARFWVIATGSSPSVPPLPGLSETPYITNREIFSLPKLPESMIVLGAGPIGIEMAQAFSRLGTRVSVVGREGRILARDDRELAGTLMNVLEAEGVEFHLDAGIEMVRDLGPMREVVLRSGDREARLQAEVILVALGRECNTRGLGLEDIGVQASKRGGLVLDRRLRTTRKHIFAAGDATGTHQFTHAAGYEGGIVLANAIFRIPRAADYTRFPWCTYTDPELASIGMNEHMAQQAGVRYTVVAEEFRANDRAQAEGRTVGKVKLLLDARSRPIGVQMLGPHAGDLIAEWVAVMAGGVGLTALAGAVHPYPTLGEINKRAASAFLAPRLFSEKVRKGLRFFFGLKGQA